MQFYTYCSYKGSYNGFQYAFYDDAERIDGEWIDSILSTESARHLPDLFGDVKRFMERESGYRLILKKQTESTGILMLKGLEETVQNAGTETDFFLNIAFVGLLEDLKQFAGYFLNAFIETQEKAEEAKESECLKLLREMFKKSEDRERYLLNAAACRKLLDAVKSWAEEQNDTCDEKTGWKYETHSRYDREKDNLNFRKRIRKVKREVIASLVGQRHFSERYILIITDGDGPIKSRKANMVFDLEYIARKKKEKS